MNSINSVKNQVKKALSSLEIDLSENSDAASAYIPKAQKEMFKNKLKMIYEELKSGSLPEKSKRDMGLCYAIADSWPFDSKLGEEIANAEKAYIELELTIITS